MVAVNLTRRNSSFAGSNADQRSAAGSGTGSALVRSASASIRPSFQALRSSCQVPSPISTMNITSAKRLGPRSRDERVVSLVTLGEPPFGGLVMILQGNHDALDRPQRAQGGERDQWQPQ